LSALLPNNVRKAVERALRAKTGSTIEIVDCQAITGGCIHPALKLATDLNEDFFVKWSPHAEGDAFAAEADGIQALHDADALMVPELIGYSEPGQEPAWILMEFIPHGKPAVDHPERLGDGLAALHRSRPEPYGWERANLIGSLPQCNEVMDDWPEFWWQRRLEPQVALAHDRRMLPGRHAEWTRLEASLETLLAGATDEGPSLLHGDLWSGNTFAGPSGEPVLIDPAVYRGHREVDLAMTELFGGFPARFYSAYENRWPLREGYRERRRAIYQLYPLLVHVNLFGAQYVDSTTQALDKALRAV
jgi:fructosamine-3-kinase